MTSENRRRIGHSFEGVILGIALSLAMVLGARAGGPFSQWGNVQHRADTPFARQWLLHPASYGAPVGPGSENRDGTYVQAFHKGWMTQGRVYFHRYSHPAPTATPTPRPSPTPAPVPTSTPFIPAPPPPPLQVPTATPWPTLTLPTATPAPTSPPDTSSPALYLLSLINRSRAEYNVLPVTVNQAQSNGTASCPGSIGHSQAMADTGGIWHVNDQYPSQSFPNNLCVPYMTAGENVGESASGNELSDIQQLHELMMQEDSPPRVPGCSGSHACSIINPGYTQVGIGIYEANGATWLTEDFTGFNRRLHRIRHMPPIPLHLDSLDAPGADIESPGDLGNALSVHDAALNFGHLRLAEFRATVRYAKVHPPLTNGIDHVPSVVRDKKMVRVTAAPVVTAVTYKVAGIKYAVGKCVRNPMSPLRIAGTNCYGAIPASVDTSGPLPALRPTTYANLGPEPCSHIPIVRRLHIVALQSCLLRHFTRERTTYCNIINPAFRSVGIGLYYRDGVTWLTTDFVG